MNADDTFKNIHASERIEDIDVSEEMQDSFLEYAYSVIYSRALPDARDGLKPVQRRILYQMTEMGLRPDRGHVKSARVVGEVMGKLHPHGDTSIYDALVRLAQSFTMRVPLVDGHGNFGSLDDGPAAARYTEARLAGPALAMTDDLSEDVVDFVPNYDNQLVQPEVLPAAYPNLLVNGASGIAVGMATNMAPHNMIEVIAAARHLLEHPDASLADLMEFVPGPDLPSGGTIVGLSGIRDAYATTGRGSFRIRARVAVEQITARKSGLVVTELPYLVGPEKVIEKIKEGVNAKKISGISDVTDLTDRSHGLRLVIGIKTGFSPAAVLDQLYRSTPLESSFNMNNVALVDGGPQTLGLRELLDVYVDHRIQVVTRRSKFRLARRQERLHLVEGLLVAILDIDEVIQVIRSSDDTAQARTRLMEVFDLTLIQTDYILELQLRRLTKFSRIELESERDRLLAEIEQLETLLGSTAAIRALVSAELADVSERFGTPRRTLLTDARPVPTGAAAKRAAAADLEVADTPCRVFLSATGRIARVDLIDAGQTPLTITAPARRSKHDAIRSALDTSSRSEMPDRSRRDGARPGIAGFDESHRARYQPRRGETSHRRKLSEPARLRTDRIEARRHRRRRRPGRRRRRTDLRHLGRPTAAILGLSGATPGPPGRWDGRNQTRARRSGGVLPGTLGRRAGRRAGGDDRRCRADAPGRRDGQRQGQRPGRVPRQGQGYRRGSRAPLPEG